VTGSMALGEQLDPESLRAPVRAMTRSPRCSGGRHSHSCSHVAESTQRRRRSHAERSAPVATPTCLPHIGDAGAELADVLELAAHADGATDAVQRALATYEQKGVVPEIERTRARLAALRAPAAPTRPGFALRTDLERSRACRT